MKLISPEPPSRSNDRFAKSNENFVHDALKDRCSRVVIKCVSHEVSFDFFAQSEIIWPLRLEYLNWRILSNETN